MVNSNTIKFILLVIPVFVTTSIVSQDYVRGVVASQVEDAVYIYYNLKLTDHKGYYDPKQKVKSRKLSVNIYYSDDYGNNYTLSQNVSGKTGNYIYPGRKKRVIWKPSSNFGYIGNIQFKVDAVPKIPRVSWGMSYSRGLYEAGNFENTVINRYQIKIYLSGKNNASGLFPLGITTVYNEYNEDLPDPDSAFYYRHQTISNIITFTAGIGVQSNRRAFSIYFGCGPMWENNTKNDTKEWDNGNSEKLGSEDLSRVRFAADAGISIKLFDTKPLTVLLPINVFIEPFDLDILSVNSGIEIQF